MLRPDGYGEWMFFSAGYAMSYSPGPDGHELFTNVFMQRRAYDEFAKSGRWPKQSMFLVDEHGAASRSSVIQKGHYQTNLTGLAVGVKDSERNADPWAYYAFTGDGGTAGLRPEGNCRSCHDAQAAVEHTFVQFYPKLKVLAKQ